MSRQSLSWMDSPPKPSSQQLRFDLADGHEVRGKLDAANDESLSPLDPRRFTPTLHASLVSEILSLRRELEGKSNTIETLELSLDVSRSEEESLQESLAVNAKENRTLKKQLQLLEGGSLSAVTELTKERDDAWESIAESRRRLEDAQKRAKSHQDQAERTQELWDLDRQRWEDEKRKLETKVHIVEGRLKTVINEITTSSQGANGNHVHQQKQPLDELDMGHTASTTPRALDSMSMRSDSPVTGRRNSNSSVSTYSSDVNHIRCSVTSLTNGKSLSGTNLADELAFDETEDEEAEGEDAAHNAAQLLSDDESESFPPIHEQRPMSSQSLLTGQKARRILGLSFDSMSPQNSPIRDHWSNPASPRSLCEIPETPISKATYRDVGIQFTPPPSPLRETMVNGVHDPFTPPLVLEAPCTPPEGDDIVGVTGESCPAYETLDMGVQTSPATVVSTECQTAEDFPGTQSQQEIELQIVDNRSDPSLMITASTQTEEAQAQAQAPEPSAETLEFNIPMITIQPPMSNPNTPRTSVVLPPQTKNAFSQTVPEPHSDMQSCGMQTEEIRVDRRPVRIPSDLLPSAFPDYPTEAAPADEKKPPFVYQPYRPPPATSVSTAPRLRDPPPVDAPMPLDATSQAYPGNNDNGPLTGDMQRDIRRPFRSSSLFAGFDHESDDEVPHLPVEEVFNDDDSILNRPMASYTIRMGKLVSKPSSSILDESPMEMHEDEEFKSGQAVGDERFASGSLRRSSATRGKPTVRGSTRSNKTGSTRQPPTIRRTAMMSSSVAAHQSSSRPRSPSVPNIANPANVVARPPFPVPARLSSRKVPTAASEGAQSPTPYGNGSISDHSTMGRDFTLRKIRSAAAVSKPHHYRDDHSSSIRSPTAMSSSSAGPESPQYPNHFHQPFDLTTLSNKNSSTHGSRRPSRAGEAHHERKESAAVSVQQTSVVDAIAQTMVGEWMYKYVRRRKSFGMSEAQKDKDKDGWEAGKNTEEMSANISGNGVRHKRWVWLAPYERAVMWSSKQPTSGTALLGKSGRKLTIQSVLDVKDENPLPRGAAQQNSFNRSILILTPQRALKFTAMSLERHFVWLTALSFLSHSSLGLDDLATLPPVPQVETGQRPLTAALRRNPIRDSIRVAKGKNRPVPHKSRAAATTNQATVPEESFPELPGGPDHSIESADPPNIPRFASHSRKRSNTAPKPMPMANPFRSFSGNAAAPSTYSSTTAGSSDLYSPTSATPSVVHSGQSSFSHRTSEASGHAPAGMANFFDAVGTVRMEAFVDRAEVPRQRGYRGKKKDQWPQSPDIEFRESEVGSNDFFRSCDPFRGF
ncbi:hypothetical protein FQN49_006984 [Arthroderma sp. PD_2]|nr:hypothetical protein FQN49_006984 [Arthroderma sp. PD_2]